jgi:UDP-4-amino-4,6-dideoxy-N-acetyl-beta-L-altrosamine transaminase
MTSQTITLPYGRQSISDADIAAVVSVLRSDWLTQGPAVPAFEEAVASYCHTAHAVAVNSATSALHIACLALGVGAGDLVWTSPNTFVASANCARYCGADVDFVDIHPDTLNLCPEQLSAKLARARQAGRLPKVVIPVHFAGQSCEMAEIHALAMEYGFRIIEDASHAIGGRYRGEPVGCGRYSDITVLSFHPVKIITSAEGGMALTQDPALARAMRLARSHGVTRDPNDFVQPAEGPWHYEQQALGWNYRMTDLQAALGLSQMQRLDAFVARRNALAARYDHLLADLPLARPRVGPDRLSSFHLYVVGLSHAHPTQDRSQVFAALRQAGIGVNLHYQPVHLQPYYRQLGFHPGQFPCAEHYSSSSLTLPLYPDMQDEDVDRVSHLLGRLLQAPAATPNKVHP